jgi:hypothetical protein
VFSASGRKTGTRTIDRCQLTHYFFEECIIADFGHQKIHRYTLASRQAPRLVTWLLMGSGEMSGQRSGVR